MARQFASFEEIAAHSSLMATAGEFYPRNSAPTRNPIVTNHPSDLETRQNRTGGELRSNEHYTRNREPKSTKKENHRYRKSEREVVRATSDGRMWRDGDRQDRRRDRDAWYSSEYQPHSSRNANGYDSNRNGEALEHHHRGPNNSRGRHFSNHTRDRYNEPLNGSTNATDHREPHSDKNKSKGSRNSDNRERTVDYSEKRQDNKPPLNVRNYERQGRQRFYQNNDKNDRAEGGMSRRKEPTDKMGKAEKGKNQMEELIGQLSRGTLECLVCCETVKQSHATWGCRVCYHVLHLRCVVKWANASRVDDIWRCPACRHVSTDTPTDYRCFCGKTVEPQWNRSDCPHTCGDTCGLSRASPCTHKCTLPCHPGPCPPCHQYVTRECGCGRVSRTVPCSDTDPVVCGAVCERPLNCGHHTCQAGCHGGPCDKCQEVIKQECYCGRASKEVACAQDSIGVSNFACEDICGKKLLCGNHECSRKCHPGPCWPCELLPEKTQYCPCGRSNVNELMAETRSSCLDPIPTCGRVCCKLLACGEPGSRHECGSICHEGQCPPCPRDTLVRCRCGHMNKMISCSELLVRADDARCEKKCNKSRKCGKHKCREACCIDVDHVCPLPCNKTLSCGTHRCEALCHAGYCRPCTRDTFQELRCRCGYEVLFPPVPCGTRAPACSRPCSRPHGCDHPATHHCHDLADCPPCIVLVEKKCFGGHERRPAVLCSQEGFSCGIACGRALSCGRHTCPLPCHEGDCLQEGQACSLPCTVARSSCGHPCCAPCHEAPCPDIPCKQQVKITCECGLRFASRACADHAREYQQIATAQLASKMADLAAGGTVDLSSSKKISYKTLECNDECKLVERNRRLAVGLQIRNPDLSSKLTPKYSDFLRQWGKKDAYFCQMVHDKLTDLVQLAKQSKQKSRSHSFDSMNRDKRQFIHDYCEHFGCESVAYDQEPHRNVVATATRDKSWLPGLSLLEVLQREGGARKVPLPSNVKTSKLIPTLRSMEVLSARASGSGVSVPPARNASSTAPTSSWRQVPGPKPPSPVLDYFDMTTS